MTQTNNMATNSMDFSSIMTLLPTFEGKPSQNINLFLTQFNDITKLANLDDSVKLIIIKTKLREKAYEYSMENSDMKEINDYKQFCKKLKQKYAPQIDFAHQQQKLLALNQTNESNVEDYAEQIKKATKLFLDAAELSNSEGAKDFTHKMMLNKFLEGLKSNIQLEVRKESPKTFDEAVEIARRIEKAVNLTPQDSSVQNQILIDTIMNMQQKYSEKIDALTEQLNNINVNKNSQQTQLFCAHCKTHTHNTENCRKIKTHQLYQHCQCTQNQMQCNPACTPNIQQNVPTQSWNQNFAPRFNPQNRRNTHQNFYSQNNRQNRPQFFTPQTRIHTSYHRFRSPNNQNFVRENVGRNQNNYQNRRNNQPMIEFPLNS